MTSYFDERAAKIHSLYRENPKINDDYFLHQLCVIELKVIRHVTLNTGDREFPDDLREEMLLAITKHTACIVGTLPPRKQAVAYATTMHTSGLLSTLHSLFLKLASRRIKTRFGMWTDSPSQNLLSRGCHDCPACQADKPDDDPSHICRSDL